MLYTLKIGLVFTCVAACCCHAQTKQQPNIILIFTDDQGYADLGCYGSPDIKTPRIDQMAAEGIRFTDFYVASSVCSASRAALLTGRRPARNGVGGVFFPNSKGMNSEEITIAEVLKTVGYKTACFGKWHLGDLDESCLPTGQGFDEYFGIPYSNDMFIGPTQPFAKNVVFREGYTLKKAKEDQAFVAKHMKDKQKIKKERGLADLCPLMEGCEIVEYPADQATLTKRYFDRTIQFIDQSKGQPFFIYLTPAMPHVPLFASEPFKGKSKRGLYGDVIEEIDWNVGRLLDHLKKRGLDETTMVVYSSDNGPWLGKGQASGSAGTLRDGKFSNYEGGVRVPCIMRWPGHWKNGVESSQVISTLDLLPTFAHYALAALPNVELDGLNVSLHLEDPSEPVQRTCHFYSDNTSVGGVRKGGWKLLSKGSISRTAPDDISPQLYRLETDPSETQNIFEQYPEKVKELSEEIERIQQFQK